MNNHCFRSIIRILLYSNVSKERCAHYFKTGNIKFLKYNNTKMTRTIKRVTPNIKIIR